MTRPLSTCLVTAMLACSGEFAPVTIGELPTLPGETTSVDSPEPTATASESTGPVSESTDPWPDDPPNCGLERIEVDVPSPQDTLSFACIFGIMFHAGFQRVDRIIVDKDGPTPRFYGNDPVTDCAAESGWRFTDATKSAMELCGAACSLFRQTGDVEVIYQCGE